MTDLFLGDDGYHGGAFMLSANFGFYARSFIRKRTRCRPSPRSPSTSARPDSYRFYLDAGNIANLDKLYLKGSNWLFDDQFKHDTYDAYWQARDLSRHMKNVHCAVLVVGGWFDAEDLMGPYRTFYAINKFNPETPTTLVEGPWVHGGWSRGDGSRLGDVAVQCQDRRVFSRQHSVPLLRALPEGQRRGAAQGRCL